MRLFQMTHSSSGAVQGKWWIRAKDEAEAQKIMVRLANLPASRRKARPVSDFKTPRRLRLWVLTGF